MARSTPTRALLALACAGVLVAGCQFQTVALSAGDDVFDPDAAADARVAVDGPAADAGGGPDAPSPPDAPPPPDALELPDAAVGSPDAGCAYVFVRLCDVPAPTAPFEVGASRALDTDTDPACATLAQPGGSDACLVAGTRIAVAPGAVLTVVGSRPLVLWSTGEIAIDGLLDVASRRGGRTGPGANHPSCAPSRWPEDDPGGAAGGPGGSFGGRGGDGGTGDTDWSIGFDYDARAGLAGPASARPTIARGGCPGTTGGNEGGGGVGGAGGASGGAVGLVAIASIRVSATGAIRATGAGGSGGQVQSGGGGGGSGGLIVLEAPAIALDGSVSANGGGGGEGGTRVNGNPVTGNPGTDGDLGTSRAPGGSGAPGSCGDGGGGGAGMARNGAPGATASVGAGGGGGGVGFVLLLGGVTGAGTVSPPPTP